MFSLIKTNDGSNTLKLPDSNETYHSINGAITESMHIYIECGFNYIAVNKEQIKIFEMGFGTGLNAALTFLNNKNSIQIEYNAVEKYPLAVELIKKLDYSALFDDNKEKINSIFYSDYNNVNRIDHYFSLEKILNDFKDYHTTTEFDLIYFDAFGPSIQPELWTKEITDKCFLMLGKGGCLVTYCAQGQFRRNLKSSGFVVEKLPGPPGKREITRALKI